MFKEFVLLFSNSSENLGQGSSDCKILDCKLQGKHSEWISLEQTESKSVMSNYKSCLRRKVLKAYEYSEYEFGPNDIW